MASDRRERARAVMLELGMGEEWMAALDPDSPEWLLERQRETVDAFRAGDLEWMLGQTHPDAVIVQPLELPDARTYHGHEGFIEALLDWPNEWEDFRVEPKRIFAVGEDHVVTVAVHRGRSRKMGIEIEAEIVWLYYSEDGLMRRWDMFMTVEDALEAVPRTEP